MTDVGEMLVRMPKLADTLVEGTLGQWLKAVGETIGRGEPLASIETDKVTTELTSPAAGTVLELLVEAGSTVPVETPIARIGSGTRDESASASGAPASVGATGAPGQAASAPPVATPQPPPVTTPKPTPVAARLLAEHGLTAGQVPSASGRLTRDAVLSFIQRQRQRQPPAPLPLPLGEGGGEGAVPPAPVRPTTDLILLTPMRRAIADHMTRAYQTIPHGQTVMDADMTHLVAWRDQHKAAFLHAEGANLTFTVLFVHALARALAAQSSAPVDVGVAVALDAGLIVPVVRAADSLSLAQTARALADLAQRARANKLSLDETQGATMTVTNVGSFGNLTASPIVPLNQIGILGPGLVERRPLPAPPDSIRSGWRCLLSLMFDRRALTDFAADRLLRATIVELVQVASHGAR